MDDQPVREQPVPIKECVQDLLSLLEASRPASRFHLETANRAAAGGFGGQIIITLPTKANAAPETRWLGGSFKLSTD